MLDIVSRAAANQHEADLLQQEENHANDGPSAIGSPRRQRRRHLVGQVRDPRAPGTASRHLPPTPARSPADVPQPGRGIGRGPHRGRLQSQFHWPELAREHGPGPARALRAPADRGPGQPRPGRSHGGDPPRPRAAARRARSGPRRQRHGHSVGEARRLACGAGIIPAVYGGAACRWTSAAKLRLHARPTASPCRRSTTPAQLKAASARSPGARPIIRTHGRMEAGPISTTGCPCAGGTIGAPTTSATTCASWRPVRSGSDDGPRTRQLQS